MLLTYYTAMGAFVDWEGQHALCEEGAESLGLSTDTQYDVTVTAERIEEWPTEPGTFAAWRYGDETIHLCGTTHDGIRVAENFPDPFLVVKEAIKPHSEYLVRFVVQER